MMEPLGDILRRLASRTTAGGGQAAPAEEEGPSCPVCGGIGWVRSPAPLGHPDFGRAVPCACRRQEAQGERLARLYRYSNLGALARLTFENLKPQGLSPDPGDQRLFRHALEAAQAFAREPRGWLVLTGPSGCGKTHLAAAIANRALREGRPAYFITVPDLLDHLRSAFSPESEVGYDQLFDLVRSAPLLVLDDLGAHSSTPWAEEKLFQVVNHRYALQSPTIFCLAVPLEALEERLRTRLGDTALSRVLPLAQRRGSPGWRMLAPSPRMLREMTFERFNPQGNRANARQRATLRAALTSARNFAAEPGERWLVLAGPPGVGKTHLAVAVYQQRTAQGQPALFVRVPDLLDYLRSTFRPDSPVSYDQLFEQVKQAPFLVLDDFTSGHTTPWASEKLYQLVVYRHEERLPTLITLDSEARILHPGIASRLRDVRFVTTIEMDAPDYRDQGRP